ncbi:MAG: AAA family ATPase [Aureispira sp.]
MRKVYLPSLKKLKLKNYTLYPNGLDFTFDFINGVNLIIGGNGMGKTTMVNIIKYAIIGHYRKQFDYTRTYKGKQIDKRTPGIKNYFKNRLDPTIETDDEEPNVTIEFEVNSTYFVVNRSLKSTHLNYVQVTEDGKTFELTGKVVDQYKYEKMEFAESKECLFSSYEEKIEECSTLVFDDLIFFVTQVLFFGESHKTILWNENDNDDVQGELFSKFFNDPKLEQNRKEAIRKRQYYDSRSRHKSEDIRAIKKVLHKIEESNKNHKSKKSLLHDLLLKKKKIEVIDNNLDSIHNRRLQLDDENKTIQNSINELTREQQDLEDEKKSIEQRLYAKKWVHLHKEYDNYLATMKANDNCPMCQNELPSGFIENIIKNLNKCFLCSQDTRVIDDSEISRQLDKVNKNAEKNHRKQKYLYQSIQENTHELQKLDNSFKEENRKKRALASEIRNLEYQNSKEEEDTEGQDLKLFYEEIEKLEEEKKEFQKKSIEERDIATAMAKTIEDIVTEATQEFSNLFAKFASRFLGVKCKLTYEAKKEKIKRFYPVINGTLRESEEEMSESQRFFIDHAFRMSILTFFYTKPTFYIVETPDSSLDISYEENAVNVFMDFLEKPNSLILTTNLNNSHFFKYIIEKASPNKIQVLDLLSIAKKSEIQSNSDLMQDIHNQLNTINNER